MPIYDKPTKTLMAEFAAKRLQPGRLFDKAEAVTWFAEHYPQIKANTVQLHVDGMAVNSGMRKHHRSIRPGSGHDLFFKVGPGRFRLWNRDADPAPIYPGEVGDLTATTESSDNDDGSEALADEPGSEFAFERDLQMYLVRNLGSIEAGLRLYEEEGLRGIEFPAGGRYIDILAVDRNGNLVVIELKVSRGYDRTIGQLLRYMGWVQEHLAEGRGVRGIIVASDITEDLRLATRRLTDIRLIEYELTFRLRPV